MSTFQGLFAEIEGISCDRFDGANLESSVFFLSHVHSDHMQGLLASSGQYRSNDRFLERLSQPDIYLHSSPVTTMMLQKWFPDHKEKFLEIPVRTTPTLIKIPSTGAFLNVTVIPAGHCPGSVMFLFETNKTILYTGDFRINAGDLRKYKVLHDDFGTLRKIHKIYLDTTFFLKCYQQFPTRDESMFEICKTIEEWTEKSKNNLVFIQTSAVYGSEFLFIEIWRKLNMPIHVSENVYSIYRYFPEMDKAVTLNGDATQIHSCFDYRSTKSFCSASGSKRYIKPSCLIFKNWTRDKPVSYIDGYLHRVCYSCHSSREELEEFIAYLQPDEIEYNVEQRKPAEQEEMLKSIKDCVEKYKHLNEEAKEENEEAKEENEQVKEENNEDGFLIPIIDYDESNLSNFENLDYLLDSPPRKKFNRKRI